MCGFAMVFRLHSTELLGAKNVEKTIIRDIFYSLPVVLRFHSRNVLENVIENISLLIHLDCDRSLCEDTAREGRTLYVLLEAQLICPLL